MVIRDTKLEFIKGLEGMGKPQSVDEVRKNELQDWVKREFTWESHPEELEILKSIEEIVENFSHEYLQPAENIIARFNSEELTDQEADRLSLNLRSVIMSLDAEVTKRYLRAQFSYYNYEKVFYESYRSAISGTAGDRTAKAKIATSQQRLEYFVSFSAWKMISSKLDGIKESEKLITSRSYRRAK
jgi:hypothetical protein